jgi:FKBP-type peptidyl-prolyl cis-trans isomerase FklB
MVTNTGVIHSPMPTTPPPLPEKEKTSYAIGMSVGGSIKRQGIEVDMDTVVTAMKDALAGVTNHMTEAEMRSTLQQVGAAVRYKMQEEQRVKMEKEEAENKVKGDAFLASNAKVEGVKTLPDGLQYKVLKEGAGEQPKTNEVLTLNYKGTLVDGTSFDSHTNFTVPLNGRGLIKGWLDVLPMMKPGAEWQIVVPPDLGYGPKGHPPKIGPGAVLVFDMELVSVAPPKLPAVTSAPAAPNAAPAATGPTAVSGQIIRVPSAEEMKKGQKIEVITNVPPGQ